ncbi:MAG: sugar phosphate isomerase/epimerase [Lentisphaerae bacterium]|jgi:sugar phosphate isomerase/epimerase|nr:sugar phosphate isomerase/epimerase [Lentisphaerota bacterium]
MSTMKIGCGTVSFRRYPLVDALKAIRNAGYEYFETQAQGSFCPHVDVKKDDPQKFQKLAQDLGFKGITGLWSTDGALIKADNCVENVCLCLEWAQAAGIPCVFLGDGPKPPEISDQQAWAIIESRLQPILETAAKTGVKIAIEPHGAFTVTSQGLLKILALGTPETLGVNYDTANVHNATFGQNPWQHKPGFDEIDVLKSVADSVIHCHVKDYSNGKSCTPGTGIAKVAQCLDILKNSGYTGAISLETEGEHDFQQAEQIAKDAFKFLAKWG